MGRVNDIEAVFEHQVKAPVYRDALAAKIEHDVKAVDSRITGLVNVGIDRESGNYLPSFGAVLINGNRKEAEEIKAENRDAIDNALAQTLNNHYAVTAWSYWTGRGWGTEFLTTDKVA